jgi:hypothetical protein
MANDKPDPGKPELNICCIARAAQALAPRVALSFQFKSIAFLIGIAQFRIQKSSLP